MTRPAVISLCDRSGVMVRPWSDAGFDCVCVDVDHSIRSDRRENRITFTWGDVRSWSPAGLRPLIVFGFPPCTDLASSGARDWPKKHWPMLRDGMDLFMAVIQAARWSGCPYVVENPIGRISGLYHAPSHTFDPCDFGGYLEPPGDTYTKRTCLWTGNGFVMPEPRRVDPVEGSRTINLSGSAKDQRSITPRGFAQAVFEANVALVRSRLQNGDGPACAGTHPAPVESPCTSKPQDSPR